MNSTVWKKANPEKAKVFAAKYRAKHKDDLEWKARQRAAGARSRAKYKGTPAQKARQRIYDAKRNAKTAVLAKLTPKEYVIEKYLVDAIKERGGFCPKFNDVGRRGAPDRLVIVPNNPVHFVELKRPVGGYVAPWQKRYHEQLRVCGQKVWVLNSIEQVDDFLLTL
jgi:hypothetical protein